MNSVLCKIKNSLIYQFPNDEIDKGEVEYLINLIDWVLIGKIEASYNNLCYIRDSFIVLGKMVPSIVTEELVNMLNLIIKETHHV